MAPGALEKKAEKKPGDKEAGVKKEKRDKDASKEKKSSKDGSSSKDKAPKLKDGKDAKKESKGDKPDKKDKAESKSDKPEKKVRMSAACKYVLALLSELCRLLPSYSTLDTRLCVCCSLHDTVDAERGRRQLPSTVAFTST